MPWRSTAPTVSGHALGEGLDLGLGDGDLAVGPGDVQLRDADGLAADGDLAVEVLREELAVDAGRVGGEVPGHARELRAVVVLDLHVEADRAGRVRQIDEAVREADREPRRDAPAARARHAVAHGQAQRAHLELDAQL